MMQDLAHIDVATSKGCFNWILKVQILTTLTDGMHIFFLKQSCILLMAYIPSLNIHQAWNVRIDEDCYGCLRKDDE